MHDFTELFIIFFSQISSSCGSALPSSAVYFCSHTGCSATFTTQQGHSRHMKRHSGVYTYQCPYCNKGFSSTNGIKYHLRSKHTGLVGLHCNKCRQEFESVHQLKEHLEANNCIMSFMVTQTSHI